MARFGAHSKIGVPDDHPPDGITLTDDDLLRLRPNRGLALSLADGTERDCAHWAAPPTASSLSRSGRSTGGSPWPAPPPAGS